MPTDAPGSELTADDLDAVLGFLPAFEQEGARFAQPWPPVGTSADGTPVLRLDRDLTPLASRFLDALWERGFPRRLPGTQPGWSMDYVREPARLAAADLATLRALLPDLFFGARITGGLMASLFERGFWTRWLRRLRELRAAMPG